jgi:hypothetical protein
MMILKIGVYRNRTIIGGDSLENNKFGNKRFKHTKQPVRAVLGTNFLKV